jgi:gamma interferon inducible lysosomal thiol reductase (GILT)
MSKCPDARDCLSQLLVPVMASLSTHINFTLSYIGQATDPDDGVSCRHGPTECLGNILQLCAAQMYPDPKQWLGFAMCMENRFEFIPERWLVQECSAEYGMEFGKLNECASREDGAFGIGLLRESVERTRKAGVTLSCTVS